MAERVALFMMIAVAAAALITRKPRTAVIQLGLFSLLSSFVFLFYGAPDVAMAEAVIGSALSTVLYLVTIKYLPAGQAADACKKPDKQVLFRTGCAVLLCAAGCILFLMLYTGVPAAAENLGTWYLAHFREHSPARNAVAAIYLDYRVYDTLFETLMLMTSVSAVLVFSWRNEHV